MWLFSANLACESILVGSFFYGFFCALGSAERLSSMGRTHWSFWLVVSGAFTEGTKIEFQQEFSLLSKAILTLSLWLITVMYRLGFSCLFVLLTTANKGIAWERHFFVLRHPSQFAGLCPSLLYLSFTTEQHCCSNTSYCFHGKMIFRETHGLFSADVLLRHQNWDLGNGANTVQPNRVPQSTSQPGLCFLMFFAVWCWAVKNAF